MNDLQERLPMHPLPPVHLCRSSGGRAPSPGRRPGTAPSRLSHHALAALLLTLLLSSLPLHGQNQPRKEDEPTLKAAYLLSFSSYITWPTNRSLQQGVSVGLLGDDTKLAGALAQAVKQKPANGPAHRFMRVRDIAQAADCHVLFIARSETRRLPEILAALNQQPILTVADFDGFTHTGGGIRLFLDGTRLRMEINQANIEASGLKASTRLLRLGAPGTAGPPKD